MAAHSSVPTLAHNPLLQLIIGNSLDNGAAVLVPGMLRTVPFLCDGWQ
jgi:hypothetical protein